MRTRYWIYLILILPVFIFRDYTPDNELRYISIAEEALQNNTWFTFYNHGLIYADKPPLYFWFIMLSKILFGSYQPWIIGLLSIVPAIGIIMVMDKWLAMEKIKHNLWASNLMLITSGIFLGGILVLRMDVLMAFFITLSLYTFYKIYTKKDKPYDKWLLPIYIFLGIFTKGAMGFLTPIMSIVGFLIIKKEIRHFGHYFGLKQWGILIGLCLVWFSLVYVDGGSEYLNNILFKQTVGRGINSFHHKEPFYYYLPRIIFTFAPWSLLYLSTLIKGAWRHNFSTDIEKFFITIIVVNFVMLSLISSKLDIYLVPIYPFVAYLTSMLLMRNKPSALIITCIAIPAVVVALIFPASYMLKEMIPYKYQSLTIIRIGLFVVSAGGVAAIVYLWKREINGAISAISLGLLGMLFIASFDIEQFGKYIGYKEMANVAKKIATENMTENYAYYKFVNAPNMDVYIGQQLKEMETVQQLDSLSQRSEKTILFIRGHEIRDEKALFLWLTNRTESYTCGDYKIFIIGKGQ